MPSSAFLLDDVDIKVEKFPNVNHLKKLYVYYKSQPNETPKELLHETYPLGVHQTQKYDVDPYSDTAALTVTVKHVQENDTGVYYVAVETDQFKYISNPVILEVTGKLIRDFVREQVNSRFCER